MEKSAPFPFRYLSLLALVSVVSFACSAPGKKTTTGTGPDAAAIGGTGAPSGGASGANGGSAGMVAGAGGASGGAGGGGAGVGGTPMGGTPTDAAIVDAFRATGGQTTADAGAPDLATDLGSNDEPCGLSHPRRVPLPIIPAANFDVTKYGAKGDGLSDDTRALQAALTAAAQANGGLVSMPKGTYLSGPLTVGSSTRLDLAAGATLKMLPRSSYPSVTPLLTASNAHDIALTGAGTIDGQGQDWWTAFAADSTTERPQLVVFNGSNRVLISGLRFQNSPEEHIWVKNDQNVSITGITISTLATSGKAAPKNTDGIDITATGAFLCGNTIACGDDNIALSGNDIYIGHSDFGVGHGCSIGSITKNGVSHLVVEHVNFDGTTAGIRMKSARDRGGLAQGLTYSNITMKGVQNPIYITSYYPSLPSDPTTEAAQATTATTPIWKDITIKDVTITGSTNAGILWGLPEAKLGNITFDNVHIQATTGMVVYHATGISFVNGSTVTPQSGFVAKTYDATVTGIATTKY